MGRRPAGATLGSILVLAIAIAGAAALVEAQPAAVAIENARILVGTGDVIERGTLVYRNGTIEAVGTALNVPEDAERLDAEGLTLTPGFIDAHSSFGLTGPGSSGRALVTPSADVLDRFHVERADSEWVRAGVTATYVGPSGRNLLGGYGAVVKLDGSVVRGQAALGASFGETVLDAFQEPTTRQGMIARLRQTFLESRADAAFDPDARAVASVLARETPLHVLANTPDDILTALRLAEEFELDLVLDSAVGAHEVAEAIAEAGVAVIVAPTIIGIGDGGPYETFAHSPENAARLAEAGVPIALGTFGSRGRSIVMEGVLARAHGLPPEAALRALTLDAARILRVDDRLGSLEVGKDADLVLWEGDPVGTWGEPRRVVIGGTTVFER